MKIGITGGKGGTGKSTVAVNLSVELSKHGKTLLLDMDSDCPNDHILLGVELKNRKDVSLFLPKINNNCNMCGLCVEKCPENALFMFKDRIKVLTDMCSGCKICKLVCPQNAIDEDRKIVGHVYFTNINENLDLGTAEILEGEKESVHPINYLKKSVPENYDYYIYDTAAGTQSKVTSALKDVDLVFAITEPTPFGAHDLKTILELTRQLEKKTFVVINRCDIGDNKIIEDLCRDYGVEIISRIKFDRRVMEYYIAGKSFDDSIDAIKEIKKLVDIVKSD